MTDPYYQYPGESPDTAEYKLSEKAPVKANSKKIHRGTAKKILLADDEPVSRGITVTLLERNGYTVKAVKDGKTVLEMLQRERYDILLTDISMPDMDGTQVAQIIRSGEREGIDKLIPIIAMTAHAFPQDRERFLSCGMNDYIAKPINFERLLGLIEETCSAVPVMTLVVSAVLSLFLIIMVSAPVLADDIIN